MVKIFQKKLLLTYFKIALGLTLLYFSIWKIDWQIFYRSLLDVEAGWLFLAVLSVFVSLALKVVRWGTLLRFFRIDIPLRKILTAYFIGQSANILFFFRGGEIVRVGWAHQLGKDDNAAITATLVIEKYLDLIMLSIFILLISTFLPQDILRQWQRFSPYLIIGSVLLIILVIFAPRFWNLFKFKKVQNGFLQKILNNLEILLQSSLWLQEKRKIAGLVGISVVAWVIMFATNLILFQSLSLSIEWQAAALVLILIYLGLLPALMPGNIGPFTYFAQLALLPFVVESSIAFTFAVILYSIVTLPPLVVTGFLLIFQGTKKYKLEIE